VADLRIALISLSFPVGPPLADRWVGSTRDAGPDGGEETKCVSNQRLLSGGAAGDRSCRSGRRQRSAHFQQSPD